MGAVGECEDGMSKASKASKAKPVPIWKDEREIKDIWEIGVEEMPAGWLVGTSGVTKIVAYCDDGIRDGDIAWFAVYKGEEIVARVPAYGFGVEYKESET
jgi:hypothetical protein